MTTKTEIPEHCGHGMTWNASIPGWRCQICFTEQKAKLYPDSEEMKQLRWIISSVDKGILTKEQVYVSLREIAGNQEGGLE